MNKYTLTEEHRAQLKPWVEKWINNGLSTKPMDDEDRRICREAIIKMYAAAGKLEPRVVFVPSPFVLRFASGFAAAIWYQRSHATDAATYAATYAATRAATRAATGANTKNDWYLVNGIPQAPLFWWKCAYEIWRCYQGGNFWSGWTAFLSFFRHIAELPIDYEKWDAWEKLTIHGSVRVVHEKFCMISDRPRVLKLDKENRPHCDDGPYCAWADGSMLFAVHGVRVPAWIVLHKDRITPDKIESEQNAEVRRVMIEFYGAGRYVSHMKKVDHSEWGTLFRYEKNGVTMCVLKVINSTPEPDGSFKDYYLRVNHTLYGGRAGREARAAVASTWRKPDGSLAFSNPEDYDPCVET